MRRLTLDYERKPRSHGAGYVLLLLGCVIMAFMANHYRSVAHDLENQRAAMQSAPAGSRQTAKTDPRAAKERDAHILAARIVLNQLSVPWEGLFKALESVDEKDVALLAVSPDAAKKQIKLTGEAKTLEAMLAYHRKLAQNPAFSEVSLSDHDVVQQDPQQPVRFSATATWILANDARQ